MVFSQRIQITYFWLLVYSYSSAFGISPDPNFSNYFLVYPKTFHGREKREISSTKEEQENSKHIDPLTISMNFDNKDIIIDLLLNRDLIPKNYFEKYQNNGQYVVNRPTAQDVELCHYSGHVRGVANSWAAISTCNGIRGAIFDGEQTHYIENALPSNATNSLNGAHVVYRHVDFKTNLTCGFPDNSHDGSSHVLHRFKRSAEVIQGPYNSNKLSRYIELVLVVDNKVYKNLDEDVTRVNQHCKDIANIINSLYGPLNIFVALVGVVIWTDRDEIVLEPNGDKTLNSFLKYRKEVLLKEHPNDNAQLLTGLHFEGGVVGKALKGPICTYEFSGGVNVDHSNVIGLVATTIAHEMGHNLGMEHDTENTCSCPRERCIMSPSSSSSSPSDWSSCSREYLALAFEHGMDYCLRNKPTSLFEGPVCGNDFVEPGEQCDCGLKEKCNNPCCNATTCMLYANASCATGECCDLQKCKPHAAGVMCRSADHECDLPEYCRGSSEYCPEDVFKIDGEVCSKGLAFCYQGNCRSHTGQCRILWGPSGLSSDSECYEMNTNGNRHGNCGYNRLNQTYIKCEKENVLCGMLQCKHFNERLEFGLESAAILSHSFINKNNSIIACRTALVDFGLNEIDPGLAPDGAKCGENHMCLHKKCMSIESLRSITLPGACPNNCYGNGICNSKGHCHCNKGYDPPDCSDWGVGGSDDSGPAENPRNFSRLRILFWYMMLAVIPLLLGLFLYSYYIRKSPSYFWKRNQRRTVEKTVQIQINRNDDKTRNNNSTVQSLLRDDTCTSKTKDELVNSLLQDSLIGNFKGFSIVPISSNTTSVTNTKLAPVRPAPAPTTAPVYPIPVAAVKPMRVAPGLPSSSVPSSNKCKEASKSVAPSLPPPNPPPNRPLISSPVLDNTTSSTVKKLINKELPEKSAIPPLPAVKRTNTIVSDERKDRTGVSQKAAKIDRDTLKKLEISDPIPLNEPSIPAESLPLSEDQARSAIMRTHSLRHGGHKQRHVGVPSFGSMRLPPSRRPNSVTSCSRPTSPPPPCPSSTTGSTVDNGKHPAARAEYEDNIYAVIEEIPFDKDENTKNSVDMAACRVLDENGLLSEIVNEIQARHYNSVYSDEGPNAKENDNNDAASYANVRGTSNAVLNNTRGNRGNGKDTASKKIADTSTANQKQVFKNSASRTDAKSASISSSSDYLKPISTDGGKSSAKVESNISKLKVPEKSAPSYKPFSSPRKPVTPITSFQAKTNSSSEKRNEGDANSSQNLANSTSEKGNVASSVSSVVSKFNTANVLGRSQPNMKTDSKNSSTVKARTSIFEKNVSNLGDVKGPKKSSPENENGEKTSSVASIQKKIFDQSTGGSSIKPTKFPSSKR